MKKRTLFLLVLGIGAMLIGGIGSILYFRNEIDTKKTHQKNYTLKEPEKTDTIHLTLESSSNFSITVSDTDDIRVNKQVLKNAAVQLSMAAEEKDQTAYITIESQKSKQRVKDDFIFSHIFDGWYTSTEIAIPQTVQHVVIEGTANGEIHLYDMSFDQITADLSEASISFGNIRTETFQATSTKGNIHASEVKASDAKLQTTTGELSLFACSMKEAQLETTTGNISVQAGYETTKLPEALTVDSNKGSISLDIGSQAPHDLSISASTKLGELTAFGEASKETTYQTTDKSPKYQLKTTLGDITITNANTEENW